MTKKTGKPRGRPLAGPRTVPFFRMKVRHTAPIEESFRTLDDKALQDIAKGKFRSRGILYAWAKRGYDGTPIGIELCAPIGAPEGMYEPVAIKPMWIGDGIVHCRVSWPSTGFQTVSVGIVRHWPMDKVARSLLWSVPVEKEKVGRKAKVELETETLLVAAHNSARDAQGDTGRVRGDGGRAGGKMD